MLKRCERFMRVLLPLPDGSEKLLGSFPVSFSYRTAEEVTSGDMLYTNLRFSVYADRRRSPAGGYKRGMILESDDRSERFHILVPILTGRLWIMKAERVLLNGEGECDDKC